MISDITIIFCINKNTNFIATNMYFIKTTTGVILMSLLAIGWGIFFVCRRLFKKDDSTDDDSRWKFQLADGIALAVVGGLMIIIGILMFLNQLNWKVKLTEPEFYYEGMTDRNLLTDNNQPNRGYGELQSGLRS